MKAEGVTIVRMSRDRQGKVEAGKLTRFPYPCWRSKAGKESGLLLVGVVLFSPEFESSSPKRKPVVLLLSSKPMSLKYVRDRVTGME